MKLRPIVLTWGNKLLFPLFSQKAAGTSMLQTESGERVAALSTDSQQSSQQQGLFLQSIQEVLAEMLDAVNFCSECAAALAKGISTVVWMDGLYTFRKNE